MKNLRNEFTDHVIILIAIMVPALIGSWIGGGSGFVVALVIALPITIGLIRYIEGELPALGGQKKS